MSDENKANELGITGRERAFYDALIINKSAKELLNDETLKLIALELKDIVEEYGKIDWNLKESTKARMRNKIKECLKKYNYPPDYNGEEDKNYSYAVKDIIAQAEYMVSF